MSPREADGADGPSRQEARAADFTARHVRYEVEPLPDDPSGRCVCKITLDRPDRKNPLSFASYRELCDLFWHLGRCEDAQAVVVAGAGGNFCSGGDVHEIIGPLTKMDARELLGFTRMTGELVRAIRACPAPVLAAVEGVCAGAGAILAMASDLRYAADDAKVAFLFVRVGLSGADMGACALLPRIVGQGRASELLYTGRSMSAQEGLAWGFFNEVVPPGADVGERAVEVARALASGPTFAHRMTKNCLDKEWAMGLEEAIAHEAQAQALCMGTRDFRRAYQAFAARQKPRFEGN